MEEILYGMEWNGRFRWIWNMEDFYFIPFHSMPWLQDVLFERLAHFHVKIITVTSFEGKSLDPFSKGLIRLHQWFSKVFTTFLPFRTWVPSFPPSKKEYLNDQSEEFFCLYPNLLPKFQLSQKV